MLNNPYDAPQSNVSLGAKEEDYCEIRLFSTEGRLGRLRYFNRFFVALYGLGVVLITWLYFVIQLSHYSKTGPTLFWGIPQDIVLGAIGALGLCLLITFIFSVIQRLHDTNRSGWFALLLLIPAINIVLGLALLFIPSRAEPNNFGAPPPKNTPLTYLITSLFIILFLWKVFGRSLRKFI
ncbi:MAG: DUF805 domain-containing protein [Thiotrichaceae bacterium]|nr:DUF805 domain-containing protein [Thiotrichaceae bacterium]